MKYPIKSIAIASLLATLCTTPVVAQEASSDGGSTPAPNFSYYNVPGADEAQRTSAVAGSSQYIFISGSGFNARSSSQTVTYPGGGCTYSDVAVTTDLQLPEGASISGVRLFYYSADPTKTVSLYLTSYSGDGQFTDLLNEDSTLDVGYASDYFSLPSPAGVDNYNFAYALTATMDPDTRFCGMRVFYSAP